MKNLLKNSLLTFMFLFSVLFFNNTVFAAATITLDSGGTSKVDMKEKASRVVVVEDSSSTSTKSFTFKSNDTGIATVEKYAADSIKISAKNYGSTTITITSYDKTATVELPVNVYCSTFSVDDMTVAVGKSVAVTPKFTDGYTYDVNNINFDSENKSVVTTSGAKITGVKVGETTVTATVRKAQNDGATEDVVKTFKVKVVQPVESIEITKSDVKVNAGESFNIGAVVKPENATVKELSYTADNDNVEVDKTGKVTGKKAGKSVITVASTDGSKIEKKVNVTVVVPVTAIYCKNEIAGYIGDKIPINPFTNNDATDTTMTYKSANEKVATVDAYGCITLVSLGSTTVTVTAGNVKKEIKVIVMGEVTALDVAKELTIEVNQSVKLPFTVKAENNDTYLEIIDGAVDTQGIIEFDNFGKATKTATGGEYSFKGRKEGFVVFTITAKNPSGKEVSAMVKIIVKAQADTTTETKTVPVVKKAKAGKRCLTVTVGKMTNITGYQVQVATDKKFKKNKKSATGVKTKIKVKKLKKGKKYYVRVRSYSINASGKKVYSQWSKAVRSKKVK